MSVRDKIFQVKKDNPRWNWYRIAEEVGCCRYTVQYHLSPGRKQRECLRRNLAKRNIKADLIKKLGGKCVVCGYDKCVSALDFHHKNPSEKKFTIAEAIRLKLDKAKIAEEASKCILICCRCHRELHEGVISPVFS